MSISFVLPQPEKNEAWMALSKDPRWNYQESKVTPSGDLYFGESWKDYDAKLGELVVETLEAVPASGLSMHPGALAPRFVFEQKATNEPLDDDMDVYMKRLICILCGRFVVISRPSASDDEKLQSGDAGVPQGGVRYWWRYWDNEGNIYQVAMEKFRDAVGTQREQENIMLGGSYSTRNVREATDTHGRPPGDFRLTTEAIGVPWLRIPADMTSSGKEYTNLSSFFDHAWSFKYHGTTRVSLWDASLMHLARLAGVPPDPSCRSCGNTYGLLRCARCKLVNYCGSNGKFCQRDDWKQHKKVCNFFKSG
jgi:MYND finger